jgi:hypothetical protein
MSVSAVVIQITFKVVNKNDSDQRYLGYAFNKPLPSMFWQQSGYVVGAVWDVGDTVQSPGITVPVGTHYIVFGTSSENALGYWMDIEATVRIWTGGVYGPSISTTQRVHRGQYGYIAFNIPETGGLTKIDEGTVPPNTAPLVTASTGGSGGQSTSGAGGGEGGGGEEQDPTEAMRKTMEKMMRNTMPYMIGMMGMMMMMQMMMGMMQSMAGAMAGGF